MRQSGRGDLLRPGIHLFANRRIRAQWKCSRLPCKVAKFSVSTPMNKIGRNDPCTCGSGKKFKACCLEKTGTNRLPFGAIMNGMHKASKIEVCMHPEASELTCGRIIKAHTLQRSRVLEPLCDASRKVMMFYPSNEGKFEVKEIGWREASTFKAFCEKHDGPTFAPLEQCPFSGTKEQIFLTAYRVFCWETYQKERALKGATPLREGLMQGADPAAFLLIDHILSTQDQGYAKGLQELRRMKAVLDADLIASNYTRYAHAEFVLSGTPFIAAAGAVSPNYSLSGVPLQKLDKHSTLEWLAFGVDVSDQGSHFIFCWDAQNSAPSKYMAEVLKLSDAATASFLCQFCFMHCENTYFSKQWWQGLTPPQQRFVTKLMSNVNPYAQKPDYQLEIDLAPWKLSCIKMD